ncbi:MAG: PDZ domain-containing protein [Proteobacteria bacterium]|nr:PDZ domain-containing protein [Desulfobulbaceae bacterium]MBU4154050.1 PDZ domain-containing protein [Pseudomonadota bacterium]MDP2105008.1 type II secretion system protein N [Desulfobulbaceae bacterium]
MQLPLPWQRLLKTIDIVALTIVAYLCAGLWWQIVESRLALSRSGLVSGLASVLPAQFSFSSPTRDLGVILQRDLFKTGSLSASFSEQEQIDALAVTSLNLQLLGTVAVAENDDRVEPWAVILDKSSGQQNVYRQGDTVAQATIRKILRGKVVLGVQGRDEVLAMDVNPGKGAVIRGDSSSGNRIEINRQELQGAMANMSSILSQVQVKPVTGDNGEASGFALDHIVGGSLFDKIGLQNGDVIQGADGKAVTSPEDAFAIYQGLKNQPSVSLTIIRNGKPETVSVQIR